VRIAFLGNFTIKKGSRIFAEVLQDPRVRAAGHEFYILGFAADKIALNDIRLDVKGIHLYEEHNLAALLKNLKIDAVAILSIWPETYSRTFFRASLLSYPVIAPKLGNPYKVLGDEYPLFFGDVNELKRILVNLETLIGEAQLHKVNVHLSENNQFISIIIPCFNEKNNIREIVSQVASVPIKNKEIIIVDDKSNDGSSTIIKNEIEPLVTKVIYHQENVGKGGALKTGFKHATGDVVIVQDSDLEYSPSDYPKVINPILDGQCEVCYGSRFLNQESKGYISNQLANRFLTFLSNIFNHTRLTDMETCYKAMRRDIINQITIEENRYGFEPEITAKICHLGVNIHEVPISYHPRTVEEGKKIGWKDGLRAIYCILKYR